MGIFVNKYGNEFGYHSPEKTKQAIIILRASGFNVSDVSWHNDTCDSVFIEGMPTEESCLFIPNADMTDLDKDEHGVFYFTTGYGSADIGEQFESIYDFIKFAKNNYTMMDKRIIELQNFLVDKNIQFTMYFQDPPVIINLELSQGVMQVTTNPPEDDNPSEPVLMLTGTFVLYKGTSINELIKIIELNMV